MKRPSCRSRIVAPRDRASGGLEEAQGLSCTGIGVTVDGNRLLTDVGFELAPGRWLSVVGPNGAGKTTLLRALACLVGHLGTVSVGGVALEPLRPGARARLVALVPQHPMVPPGMGVLDYVLLGRTAHLGLLGSEGGGDIAVAERVIDQLDLSSYRARLVSSLSGGERQRVVLARALAQECPILLLDEPTTGLDIGHQQDVLELLCGLRAAAGLTVVSTMHDLTLAGAYADELALLAGGRLVAHGPVATTLTEDNLALITGARVRLLREGGTTIVVPLFGHRPAEGAG